jgi:hypothetical protein
MSENPAPPPVLELRPRVAVQALLVELDQTRADLTYAVQMVGGLVVLLSEMATGSPLLAVSQTREDMETIVSQALDLLDTYRTDHP